MNFKGVNSLVSSSEEYDWRTTETDEADEENANQKYIFDKDESPGLYGEVADYWKSYEDSDITDRNETSSNTYNNSTVISSTQCALVSHNFGLLLVIIVIRVNCFINSIPILHLILIFNIKRNLIFRLTVKGISVLTPAITRCVSRRRKKTTRLLRKIRMSRVSLIHRISLVKTWNLLSRMIRSIVKRSESN
jgi:hypothetical protein